MLLVRNVQQPRQRLPASWRACHTHRPDKGRSQADNLLSGLSVPQNPFCQVKGPTFLAHPRAGRAGLSSASSESYFHPHSQAHI